MFTVMFLLLMFTKSLFINSFPILKYLCSSQQAVHSFWGFLNSTVKNNVIDGFYIYLSGPVLGLLNAGSSDGRRNTASLQGPGNYKTSSFFFFFLSKGAKLDKLPVHVYEVDEEVDKDEVGWSLTDFKIDFFYRLRRLIRKLPTFTQNSNWNVSWNGRILLNVLSDWLKWSFFFNLTT